MKATRGLKEENSIAAAHNRRNSVGQRLELLLLLLQVSVSALSPAGARGFGRGGHEVGLEEAAGEGVSVGEGGGGSASATQTAPESSSVAATDAAAERASSPGGVNCCRKSAGEYNYNIHIAVGLCTLQPSEDRRHC